MTIAILVKVHDGVVLATDSASTLMSAGPDGQVGVVNVYDNANKIVNLVKGLPVGIMTWGSGSIGPVSMTTIFKDLRRMFSGQAQAPDGSDWTLAPETLDIHKVAQRVREYVVDHLYVGQFGSMTNLPALGMLVAGYSFGGTHAETYEISVAEGGQATGPVLRYPGAECGLSASGQPMAVSRLVMGVDPLMAEVLRDGLGVPTDQIPAALQVMQARLEAPLVQDAMPFQDAIDLGHFLVDTTIKLTRFLPGPATVGGPIEIAGITKHEGFKWIERKHYFDARLNPEA